MEVVFCLAFAEVALLFFLWTRNLCFDRVNALLHVPFVIQEFMQVALWLEIDANTSPESCSTSNRILSYMLALVIGGIPGWIWLVVRLQRLALFPLPAGMQAPSWLAMARRQLGLLSNDLEWPRRQMSEEHDRQISDCFYGCLAFAVGFAFYFAIRFLSKLSGPLWLVQFFGGPTCTTRGPLGHQVWPMAVYTHWAMTAILAVMYLGIFESFNLLPRPSFVFSFLRLCKLPALLFYFLYGDEWASVWYGFTSCLCVLYLGEPILFAVCHILDPLALLEDPSSADVRRKAGIGFYLAWKHVPLEMAPWRLLDAGKSKRQDDMGRIAAPAIYRGDF